MAQGDYNKTVWVNGGAPGITAERLNNIEDKVSELDGGAIFKPVSATGDNIAVFDTDQKKLKDSGSKISDFYRFIPKRDEAGNVIYMEQARITGYQEYVIPPRQLDGYANNISNIDPQTYIFPIQLSFQNGLKRFLNIFATVAHVNSTGMNQYAGTSVTWELLDQNNTILLDSYSVDSANPTRKYSFHDLPANLAISCKVRLNISWYTTGTYNYTRWAAGRTIRLSDFYAVMEQQERL